MRASKLPDQAVRAAPVPVYILHLSELAVQRGDWADVVAGGATRVLDALPPRRRAALFGRELPFRIIVVNEDCCPVIVISAEMVTVFAGRHARLATRRD